jgi:hypothetical protein
MKIKILGLLASGVIAFPMAVQAQSTQYLLQFADNTVGSGVVSVNKSDVVTGISNMSLDELTVQTITGSGCPSFCVPSSFGVTPGELNVHGTTLLLEGEIPQLGINSETALLTIHFAGPLTAQNISGPGPNLYVAFPDTGTLVLSQTLLNDLGITGKITDASEGGGIFATGANGSYKGFDGETDVQFTHVPEIDTASLASGMTLLLGALAVLRGRRKTLPRGISCLQ